MRLSNIPANHTNSLILKGNLLGQMNVSYKDHSALLNRRGHQ